MVRYLSTAFTNLIIPHTKARYILPLVSILLFYILLSSSTELATTTRIFRYIHQLQLTHTIVQSPVHNTIITISHMSSSSSSHSHSHSHSPPHIKARNSFPSYPQKQHVPDDTVDWSIPFPSYHPSDYTDTSVLQKSGSIADPIDCREIQHIGSRVTYSTGDHRFEREPAGTEKFNDYRYVSCQCVSICVCVYVIIISIANHSPL
jgi:hypothetical protein